ncbi:MAG: response regulator receiver [Nitrospirae bacterium]|nr:MAG: response regulator receiver [Nitrospirota bacterium]
MLSSKKILIADDSEFVHHICKARLARCRDCVFLSAKNGHDAYTILSGEDKIDLIVLDLNMPLMNGIEFMEKMRRNPLYKQIPVIVLSTDENEDKLKMLRSLGAWAFVKKSQADSFINMIEDALAKKPSPLLEFH